MIDINPEMIEDQRWIFFARWPLKKRTVEPTDTAQL